MTQAFHLIYTYFEQGGWVSVSLLLLYIVIFYSIGYRFATMYKGRNLDVRNLINKNIFTTPCLQSDFLQSLRCLKPDQIHKDDKQIQWLVTDFKQKTQKFSHVLTTTVLLAPLLGLLGTVIGMIETFSSLSDADLFSSSGGIAGGISQALATTQLGLIVAIPGVLISRYLGKLQKKSDQDIIQLKELFLQQHGESK